MFERIDPSSPFPPYAQIADQLRVAMATGRLVPGDALHSIRALASLLRVNPATVARAYKLLEHEGLIDVGQGRVALVASVSASTRNRERIRAAASLIREVRSKALRLGLAEDDLRRALDADSSHA